MNGKLKVSTKNVSVNKETLGEDGALRVIDNTLTADDVVFDLPFELRSSAGEINGRRPEAEALAVGS